MLQGIDTNKLYSQQNSCDYHYYQYTRSNCTNLFHKERLFNIKSCCGLQFHLQPALCCLARERSILERAVCHLAAYSDNNVDSAILFLPLLTSP